MSVALTTVPLLAAVALVLYRAVRISPSFGSKIGAVLALFAGVAPAIWVIIGREVSPKLVIGYGGLFFVGSILMKWSVTIGLLSKLVHRRVSVEVASVVQGVFSSICEMGFALVALSLVLPDLGFWQVFGFGAGAAAVEALIVCTVPNLHAGTGIGEHVEAQLAKLHSGPPSLAAAVPFIERAIATTDHIACRGLLAVGVASGRAWPVAVAFLAFAATDGLAGVCLGRRWEFAKPAVAAKLYGAMGFVAAGSALAWSLAT